VGRFVMLWWSSKPGAYGECIFNFWWQAQHPSKLFRIVVFLTWNARRVILCGHKSFTNESVLIACLLQQWQVKGFKVTGSVCNVTSKSERKKPMSTVPSLFDGELNILVSHPLLISFAKSFHYCSRKLKIGFPVLED
jgi:hypothetical protein